MKFDKALDEMAQGEYVKSEVSKTTYSMSMEGNGKLFAEGLEVKADYLTEEEMLGEWIVVTIVDGADKLSDTLIEQTLKDAYEKHLFDTKVER